MLSRDIIRELECVIEKNKGQIVGFGETKIEYMARDCLETIRTLQAKLTAISDQINSIKDSQFIAFSVCSCDSCRTMKDVLEKVLVIVKGGAK